MSNLSHITKIGAGFLWTGAAIALQKTSDPITIIALTATGQAMAWLPDLVSQCLNSVQFYRQTQPEALADLMPSPQIPVEERSSPQTQLELPLTPSSPPPNKKKHLNHLHFALQSRMLTGTFHPSSKIGTNKIETKTLKELLESIETKKRYFGPVKIDLSKSNITDDQLRKIIKRFPDIREINATHCSFLTDNGLAHLANLTNLTSLNLCRCKQITNDGLAHLANLTNLTSLNLGCCDNITDNGLAHLTNLSNLTSLDLEWCDNITDNGLAHLANLTSLTSLNLSLCLGITDNDLAHLANLTNLTSLDLGCCDNITDNGLAHLANLSNLTNLNLKCCNNITDNGLAHLANLTNLTSLNLSWFTEITNDGLAHLANLSNLTSLNLSWCLRITDNGLTQLRGKLVGCVIFHNLRRMT